MCFWHCALKVLKKSWGSTPLRSKIIAKFKEVLISFDYVCLLSRVLIDSLRHTENINTNSVIISQTSPSGLFIRFFTKFESDHFQTMPTKRYVFCVVGPVGFHLLQQRIWRHDAKLHLGLYLYNALIFWHQTLCVIVTIHWPHHINLITSPPIGQKR